MTLFIEILIILIFLLVLKVLDDVYSLLVFGAFMALITVSMDTYFGFSKSSVTDGYLWLITGLITALSFVKLYFVSSKVKEIQP